MSKLFIVGHPGLYGGSASELYCQILCWLQMRIRLHIIPTMQGYQFEPLYQEMKDYCITYHEPRNYEAITKDDAVINFCSGEFLDDLPKIKKQTDKILWVNCMTWLFDKEKAQCKHNFISHFLYQRDEVRKDHESQLALLGANAQFITFRPYFNPEKVSYSVKDQDKTHIGRISRQDHDKFSKSTLHIYEYIVSPKFKQGHFLGYNPSVEKKIGKHPDWIKTYEDQNKLSVEDFYNQIDFIVQPMDTTENLPRIGFESMYSGKPLVVDNRGGWKTLVEHGVTGFLCNHERDFIYYGSRLAYDFDLRSSMAEKAREKARELSSLQVAMESWKKVFETVY